mgnify:FL=1
MNIKQKIQELSLDQKAKLYFMGLVRQGKIDRLPEDPKAAYIKDMMGKIDTIQKISPKVDRSSLEKLTGMATELGYLNENRLSSYEMGKLPDFELLRKNVSQMLGVEVDDDVRSGRYNGREGYYSRISRRDLTNWNEEQIEKLKQAFEKTNLESENYEFEYNGVSDFEVEPGERDYPASFDYFATEKK